MKAPNITPGDWHSAGEYHIFASTGPGELPNIVASVSPKRSSGATNERSANLTAIAALPKVLSILERIYEGAKATDRALAQEALTEAGYTF